MEGLTPYQTILLWLVIVILGWNSLLNAKMSKTLEDIYDHLKSKDES